MNIASSFDGNPEAPKFARSDRLTYPPAWSHAGLADPSRYADYYFCRPIGTAAIIEPLANYTTS